MTRQGQTRRAIVWLTVAFVALLDAHAATRVAFTDHHLTVDGRPFFRYGCWGTPNGDGTEFRRRLEPPAR